MTTYREMIIQAITALKHSKGSSRQAIRKWIQYNYQVNQEAFPRAYRQALIRGVADGTFETTTGHSFRLGAKAKVELKEKQQEQKWDQLRPESGHVVVHDKGQAVVLLPKV
jgi:histone H1/5